jgi:CheY-like chemotaxis protein
MNKAQFLWVDDEIDLLKPHILFLEEKGYTTECVTNGHDAINKCKSKSYDLIFLDEHMPGLTGLETLAEIKERSPNVPVENCSQNGSQFDYNYLDKQKNPDLVQRYTLY